MKYQKLGKTDMTVSIVSMGCWTIGGGPTWGDPDDSESIRQWAIYLEDNDTIEGGLLLDLVPKERLARILRWEE